jgi:hypothetical protein
MHPFVEKFIDSNFENELNSKKLSFESDTYHNWLSPAVEIPNFDLNIIQNIKKLCEKSESQFVPVSGSYINNNWYSISGTDSWQELPLLLALQNEKMYSLVDGKMTSSRKNNDVVDRKDILNLCLNLLGIKETSHIKSLKIVTVNPGGYIHPHKDNFNNLKCLWMPLHEFSWCLKFFPFGWLKHKLGSAYLINNGKYVHAVLNNSKEKRYVLSVDFFDTPPSKKLLEWYSNNSTNWQELFTNEVT